MGVSKCKDYFEPLNGNITWQAIGSFFDHSGSLTCRQNKSGSFIIGYRLNGTKEILESILNFMKMGSLTKRTEGEGDNHTLEINVKEELLYFLLNVKDYAPLREETIKFLLENYNFKLKSDNLNFNYGKFKNIRERWTLRCKERRLLRKKQLLESIKDKGMTGEILTEEEQCALNGSEEELEGGNEE